MDENKFIKEYIELRPLYKKLSETVCKIIEEVLEINNINCHIVSHRTKTIESFSDKIDKPKYSDPFNQLTDLAGIRIIGYVEDDIKKISDLIKDLFSIDPSNSLDKSEELGVDRVGYKSVHFICELPESRIKLPEYRRFKDLKFELQIRTILQHSWAEIEHDKNYKFSGELPTEIQRRFKLIAGILEMADREFNQLSREIDKYGRDVKAHAEKGELDIPINSTSIKQYLKIKFKKSISSGNLASDFGGTRDEVYAIDELKKFGIETLQQLNEIIPNDFDDILMKFSFQGNFLGVVRALMVINDIDKYFNLAWQYRWDSVRPQSILLLEKYNIDQQKIETYLNKNYK